MNKLVMLLVGMALVLLSSVAASDCETTIKRGDEAVIEDGAFVTTSMEDFEAYVDTLGTDDEIKQTVGAAMIVGGLVRHVEEDTQVTFVGCTKPKLFKEQVCEVGFADGSFGYVFDYYLSPLE